MSDAKADNERIADVEKYYDIILPDSYKDFVSQYGGLCMKLFVIEPEVAGEIGESTIYENYDAVATKGERPIISHLHFIFMGWLGDDILEVTPCFLISEKLKKAIERSDLKGYKFEDIEISLSEEYEDMYPNREEPCFCRLLPQGTINVQDEMYSNWDGMDFCVTEKSYLVLSEKAIKILKCFQIDNADITEIFPK